MVREDNFPQAALIVLRLVHAMAQFQAPKKSFVLDPRQGLLGIRI